MSQLIVRLQTNKGVRRLTLNQIETMTVLNLKQVITTETGIPPSDQRISLERNGPLLTANTAFLPSLNLKSGAMIYLHNTIETFASKSSSLLDLSLKTSPGKDTPIPVKLTPQCTHNELGRCLHCDPARKNGHLEKIAAKCNHGPGFTCINCSQSILAAEQGKKTTTQSEDLIGQLSPSTPSSAAQPEQVATWLCNHPTSSFCPKCIPINRIEEEHKENLMQRDTVTGTLRSKVNFQPFKKFLADSKPQCANRHPIESSCPMCLPPAFPSYAFNMNCTDPHPKYPRGQCTKCMPNNITLRLQKYRHVDGISLPQNATRYMYSSWLTDISKQPAAQQNQQRVFLLFGRVIDEKAQTEDPYARRAIVSAIYQPAQTVRADGTVDFDIDAPTTRSAIDFAYANFNSKLIGWAVCTPPLPVDKKYGGKAVISASNLITAAELQWKQSKVLKVGGNKAVVDPDDKISYRLSELTTVILEQSAQVEPEAYMVSDQGMCMARDHALLPSKEDPYLLTTPTPQDVPVPSIIFHDSALGYGIDYIPDMLVVKVRTMTAASETEYPFINYHYPSNNTNQVYIRAYIKSLASFPLHQRLSDFNLLLALGYYIDPNVLKTICKHVLMKKPFTQQQADVIVAELLSHELWSA